MSKKFIGFSSTNNIENALNDAISNAKTGLTSDLITWKLDFVVGESGGFVLKNDLFVGIVASPPSTQNRSHVGYFRVEDASNSSKDFIVQISDPDALKIARDILSGQETKRVHIQGTVVKESAVYNQQWTFHIDPESIDFFEVAIEVCDATMQYVENNLDDVGGAFLPQNHWCPWTSKLKEEVSGEEIDAISSKGK